jgi:PST family polysaccharide transporter
VSPGPEAAPAAAKGRLGSALFWLYLSSYGGKLLVFVSVLILARVLSPQDFALVALVLAILAFIDIVDVGVGGALIWLDRDEAERSRSVVFTLNIVVVSALIVVLNLLAPWIAQLANGDPRTTDVLRLLSLSVFVRALGQTHDALLARDLDFRRRLVPDLIGGLVKGGASVILALTGAGVWSLVFGQLAGTLARTLLLWLCVPFRPRLEFGLDGRARRLMAYGGPVIATAIIANGAASIDYILVGKYLGLLALGYYVIAFRLPELIVLQALANIHTVLFPYYSRAREEGARLDLRYLTTLRIASLVVAPIPAMLTALATPVVLVVFGSQWEPAAGVMPGIALGMTLLVIGGIPGDLFKAQGKPWIQLILASAYLCAWIPGIVVLAPHGIDAVAWLFAALAALQGIGSWAFATRVLGQSWRLQWAAIAPAAAAGTIAGAVAYLATLSLGPLAALLVGVPILWLAYGGCVLALDPQTRALARRLVRRSAPVVADPAPS